MAYLLFDEYVEIDGYPIGTPAVILRSDIDLYNWAELPDLSVTVPYKRGVIGYRSPVGAKRISLPIAILGDYDKDNNPILDARAGLVANRDELYRAVKPPYLEPGYTGRYDGSRLLRWHRGGGDVLSGPARLVGGLQPTEVGPAAMFAALDFVLLEGGLRSEVEIDVDNDESGGPAASVIVPNPGTDWQDSMRISLSGTATAVRLSNLTIDPAGGVYVEFGGDVSAGVEVDTGEWTAIRDSLSVVGLLSWEGTERWLPLVEGDNEISIEPTGGTCIARFRHFPFYS